MLSTAQEQIIGRLHGAAFTAIFSGRTAGDGDGRLIALLALPEAPRRVVVKTLPLHGRPHVQINAYTQKQHFTKNFPTDDSTLADVVNCVLGEPFTQVHVQTPDGDLYVRAVARGGKAPSVSVKSTPPSKRQWEETGHDSDKNYLVTPQNSGALLQALGIAGNNGAVRAPMQAKYRQINHFLSIATQLDVVRSAEKLRIIDCGCGKAYLSLALYHVLTTLMQKQVELVGIDTNTHVIDACNHTAQALHFKGATFLCTPISGYQPQDNTDLVIALHACDTATDDALALAVRSNARAILAAPCCHHYVNSRLRTSTAPADVAVLLQDGITRERLADMLTDSLRRDILHACGYSATLMEFVAPEHTMKNILIRAERTLHHTDERRLDRVREDIARWQAAPKLAELLGITTAAP